MARIRSWRPELFESKRFSMLSEGAQLMLLKLGSLADDEGLVRAEPHYLHATRYLYDRRTYADLSALVDELEAARWIRTYHVDGDRYAELIGWRDPRALLYQAINRPTPSRLPEPPPMPEPDGSGSTHGGLSEHSRSTHGALTDGSGSGSGSGREGKGSGSGSDAHASALAPTALEALAPLPEPRSVQDALDRVRAASDRRQHRLHRAAAKRVDVEREGYCARLRPRARAPATEASG